MGTRKNIFYKVMIMLLCIIVIAVTLNQYAILIRHLITIKYDWKFELCMVTGQLIFQFPFIYKKTIVEKMNYYFNMLLVSMQGSMLLIPLIILNGRISMSSTVNIIYFFAVVLFMFFAHKKRVKELDLPSYISYTWVLYRFLILIFILI
jgi:hypothetical protein